jgi:ammonium transporter Rh
MSEADARDMVQNWYPFFQDVHVMIFIGFGFLMTFIKTNMWTALCFNWVISAWALQWGILSQGFWHQVIHGEESLHKISVSLDKLIVADFGAGVAMITFGAVLGRCNLQQLMFLTFWEMIWWGLNESICAGLVKATDAGGSSLVHLFGAYYGLAACFFFQPDRSKRSKNNQGSYMSEAVAFIGSIFLWMYWPSFNGALASGVTQHRIVLNTVLSISGSVIASAFACRFIHHGKYETEIMLNATLAGGVAIGTCCDIIVAPWGSILIGFVSGILSSYGFAKLSPWLSEHINLVDTCGVHNLHGLPGIYSGVISAIAIAGSAGKGFPDDYFAVMADGGTRSQQAAAQIYMVLISLAISIVGGLTGGYICSLSIWQPVSTLYHDVEHFEACEDKMPRDHFEGQDETYDHIKASFADIQQALQLRRALYNTESQESAINTMVEDIWAQEIGAAEKEMRKNQCQRFLQGFVKKNNPQMEVSDAAFEEFFEQLDVNKNGRCSKQELGAFLLKFTA